MDWEDLKNKVRELKMKGRDSQYHLGEDEDWEEDWDEDWEDWGEE